MNFTIRARFTVCGRQLPETDITPVIAISFILTVVALIGHFSRWSYRLRFSRSRSISAASLRS